MKEGNGATVTPQVYNGQNAWPGCDPVYATNEELLAWLSKVINQEMEKDPKKQDIDLISECVDFINEISIDAVSYTEAELNEKLRALQKEIKDKSAQILPTPNIKRRRLRIATFFVAMLAAVFMSVTVAAISQGYPPPWEFISSHVKTWIHMSCGEKLQENEVTYIKGGEGVKYHSIEALLAGENLTILYPGKLPQGIMLTSVAYQEGGNGAYTLYFSFSDPTLCMSISEGYSIGENVDELTHREQYNASVGVFYIMKLSNQTVHAVAQIDGYEYQFYYHDYAELISIIDNLKGIQS